MNCKKLRAASSTFTGRAALAAAATVALVGSNTFATTYSYIGVNGSDVNVASNWSPSTAVPTAGDIVTFDNTAAANAVSGVLTLTNGGTTTTTSPGLTLNITSTSALTIDSASTVLFRYANTAITIASGAGAFSLGNGSGTTITSQFGNGGSTQTFTNSSSNVATINSDVMMSPGGNSNHILSFSGDWALKNAIDNTGTDKTQTNGTMAITKTGSGTVTLSNTANNYSGNTIVNGGTLKTSAANALGYGGQYSLNRAVGTTTVDGSTAAATLDLNGTTQNEPLTLSGGTSNGSNGANLINSNTTTTATLGDGVAAITFSNAGTTYGTSTGFNSLITTITGGGGSGATGTAWKGSSAGTGVNVTFVGNAGSGYTSAPTVTITGANGESGAVATAVLSSLTLTGTNNNVGGAGNLIIAAGIGGTGGFNKIGAGTTTLKGVNTFSGTANVNAGTLLVNSSAAAVNVNGGTLGGGGSVGAVTVGSASTVAPSAVAGTAIGTLTTGNVTFGTGGHYAADVGAGTSSDLLAIGGTLDLSAAGDVLDLTGLDANFDGSTKTLATYASLTGTFDLVTLNGNTIGTPASFTVNGQTYGINYGTGTSSAITVAVVPEPASLAGLAMGGMLLASRRRRMR